jgi:hypothetical protein
MPRPIELLLCLAAMLALPAVALSDDVLLDTFEDETVGAEPESPDIGSYSGTALGDHAVIDPGDGNLRLRCSDALPEGGCRFTLQPTQALDRAVTEYLFRVESGATAAGANDFEQQLILSPPGTNLSIEWSAFVRQLGVRIFAGGIQSDQFFVSRYQWSFDTDHLVEIETDASTDRYTLSIDGQVLVDDDLGADFTTLDRLTFRTGWGTLGAQQIDDIRIAALPEPGSALCAVAALVTLACLGQRGRRKEPRAEARGER